MSDVKWIKITTNIFDDEKMLLIESLPDSYAIITVWFKLLCLAGKQNNSGVFMMGRIAYTDKMLATIFRMKESTVTMALRTFEEFEMIEIIDGVITIPNWGKHQNLEQLEERRKYQREYQKEYRKKQKLLASADEEEDKHLRKCLRKSNVNTLDIEEDKDIKNKIIEKEKKEKEIRHKYGEYSNVFLSDSDYEKLKSEFPLDYNERIESLSSYIASTGKSYKNHLATIRNWAKKDDSKPTKQSTAKTRYGNFDPNEAMQNALKRSFFEDEEKESPKTVADCDELRERAEALKNKISKSS